MKMIKWSIGLTFLLAMACNSAKSDKATNENNIPEIEEVKTDKLKYEIVYQGQKSNKTEKSTVIIKNNEDFTTQISDLNIPSEDYEKILNIDLDSYDILVYYFGINAGTKAKATLKSLKNNKTTQIDLQITNEDAIIKPAETSAYAILQIPKNKEVEFVNVK